MTGWCQTSRPACRIRCHEINPDAATRQRSMRKSPIRLGLIGSTGHWHTYAPALDLVPDLKLVAVAAAGPEETTGAFDHAPGLTVDTRRYDDARKMLDTERLDVVQVAARNDRIPVWSLICLERGLPVMAEKPLAMDLPALEELFQAAQKNKAALVPMHTMRNVPALAAIQQAVARRRDRRPAHELQPEDLPMGHEPPRLLSQPQDVPGPRPLDRHPCALTGCTGSWATCSPRSRARRDDGTAGFPGMRQPGGVRTDHAKRRRGIASRSTIFGPPPPRRTPTNACASPARAESSRRH